MVRRISLVLMFAVWATAVAWYWHGNVPVAATKLVRVTTGAIAGPLTPAGELPLLQTRWEAGPGSRVVRCGPIEFWAFPECRKVREILVPSDVIVDGPLPRTREVLVRRGGRLLIVDSETGQVLKSLPGIPKARRFALSPLRADVLIDDGTDIHCIELEQGSTRWRISGYSFEEQVAGDLFVARPRRRSSFIQPHQQVLKLSTGEPDTRFDHLGLVVRITLSSNGELAVVFARPAPPGVQASKLTRFAFNTKPGVTTVCRVATGEILWTVPATSFPVFAADDQELHSHRMEKKDGRLHPCRWRAADGTSLPDFKPGDPSPLISQSTDGQFGFWYQNPEETRVRKFTNQAVNFLARHGVRIVSFANQPRPHLREVRSGRILGPLPVVASNTFLPGNKGLISTDHQFLRYYALPPRRDYWWLARWTLLPPLGVVITLRVSQLARDRWRDRCGKLAAQPPAVG